MDVGYCSKCNGNVLLTREEINVPLVIVLAIFTGGLGLIIYFLIYRDKPVNRCVHCKSVCESEKFVNNTTNQKVLSDATSQNEAESMKHCSNCGVELGDREGVYFCAFCGFQIAN